MIRKAESSLPHLAIRPANWGGWQKWPCGGGRQRELGGGARSCKKRITCVKIIVNDLLLLVISTKSIELVFCLRYVSFHLILNLLHKKSSQQNGVHDIHETMWHTQPNHHIITNESCFGHGCVTWFDDNHEKHNYTTQGIQPQAQDYHSYLEQL